MLKYAHTNRAHFTQNPVNRKDNHDMPDKRQ